MTPSGTTFSRILITRMRFIGDVILTTPLLRSVRAACPGAYVAYMGDRTAVSLLEHHPCLDEIIPFDYSRPTLLEQPRVALLLRRRKFDLVIDLFGNPRSALLTSLSGAATRVGQDRKGRGRFYTVHVRDDGRPKTAVRFHNQFLEAVGMTPTFSKPEIFLTDDERREGRIYLQWLDYDMSPLDMSRPIIGIHPGASWPAKRWFPEKFAALADMLTAKLRAQVLLVAGPRDHETVDSVLARCVGPVKVVRDLPLRQLAALMAHCALFIANDAGPMHMAAAVGTRTIGLFGPGEEEIWFPYPEADGHKALRQNVPCHPCHLDFCNREGEGYMECMKLLGVEEVFGWVVKSLPPDRAEQR